MPHHPNSRPAGHAARRFAARLALVAMASALGACASVRDRLPDMPTGFISPYKIDIVQGNVVTREQAELLRPGMPSQQVRDILGTPLVSSVFHGNRWDYVFTFKRQGQEPQRRRLTVFFSNEVLERVEADALPSEAEFVSSLDVRRRSGKAPALEATPEQLKSFAERNAAAAPPVPAPMAPVINSYPPLEPSGASR